MDTNEYQSQSHVPGVSASTTLSPLPDSEISALQSEENQPPSLPQPDYPKLNDEAAPPSRTDRTMPGHAPEATNADRKKSVFSSTAPTMDDPEAGGPRQSDAIEMRKSGKLDLVAGFTLGLIVGPFSLLLVVCWRTMASDDMRRARFLMGCSAGIIAQIFGFAIAYSVYKLKSRQGP